MGGARPSDASLTGPESALSLECLESACMERLAAFRESADPSAFQAFYGLSRPLFSWYAVRLLRERGKELESVLTRFYAFICEEALSPMGRLPDANLLGWCKAALVNLVELHLRGEGEDAPGTGLSPAVRIRPMQNEIGLRERLLSESERVAEGIAEVLVRGDGGLSELEREVLAGFYGNGRDLATVCRETGLSEASARRVLACARSKVYLAFFEGPGRFLSTDTDGAPSSRDAGEVEG